MHDFLVALEQTSYGKFIHESDSLMGFAFFLTVHVIGMCFIVGANSIVSMRLLGMAPSIPLQPLRRLFPFMWFGLALTIITGFSLATAAATTRLLNPILLVKIGMIAVAAPIMFRMQKKVFDEALVSGDAVSKAARTMAAWQIFLWVTIVIAGRLIAYSATILGDGY